MQHKKTTTLLISLLTIINLHAQGGSLRKVSRAKKVRDHIVVEAESFFDQDMTFSKSWYIQSHKKTKKIKPDPDKKHLEGASQGAYIEVLPETFLENGLTRVGVNYSPTPGVVAIVSYKIDFKTTGQYFVWVKGFCSSFHDNSIHVGIDNTWPKSGTGIYYCEGQNNWTWSSKLRINSDECNSDKRAFITVNTPGEHIVQFSMREDGFEFDKFILTNDGSRTPY